MTNFFRTDGWVKTPLGPAIPGAQVYVCTQPANVGSAPPSPLANIYSDPLGANLITQPIYTDGFGHYDFYAAQGVYTLVIVNGGIIQQVYPDQSVGGEGSSGPAGTSVSVNGSSVSDLNLSSTMPTAPAGNINASFQVDANGNVSAYVPLVSAGFPVGTNVLSMPSLSGYGHTGGLNGYSTVLQIPSGYVESFTAGGCKVGVLTTNVTGLVLNAASIGATLPGSTVWSKTPTVFTFPAGSFASASTLYLSNATGISMDAQHDWYIILYWDPSSANGNAYANFSGAFPSGGPASGYVSGDQHAAADASGFQSLGSGSVVVAQVLTA